ncbi:MAG TPA: hypothetical protein VIJ93_05845, partial [bacterium]
MSRLGGVSFRILHPDPFDLSRSSSFPGEICLVVEFSSRSSAVQLETLLTSLPHARHVRLEKSSHFNVLWVMSLSQALFLPKVLKPFPEL